MYKPLFYPRCDSISEFRIHYMFMWMSVHTASSLQAIERTICSHTINLLSISTALCLMMESIRKDLSHNAIACVNTHRSCFLHRHQIIPMHPVIFINCIANIPYCITLFVCICILLCAFKSSLILCII